MIEGVPYYSKMGDTLELICYEFYGNEQGGNAEFVLRSNPGIAELGPELPINTRLILPPVPQPEPATKLQLFS